jgi:hypothetical protein
MSSPLPDAGSLLLAEHLNGVLDACHYRGVAVELAGKRSLAPGCSVLLQFGDRLATLNDGGLCLTIRCGLQINGAVEHTVGATYWQVQMPPRRLVGPDRLSIAIEGDLILAGDMAIADALARGRDTYRHLRVLIADARDTLGELRLDESGRDDATGPVLRVEARLLGDLVCGRSGLVAGKGSRVSARRRRVTDAACGFLLERALPDLARAVAGAIPQARDPRHAPTTVCPLSEPAATACGERQDDPSIVPDLELVQ